MNIRTTTNPSTVIAASLGLAVLATVAWAGNLRPVENPPEFGRQDAEDLCTSVAATLKVANPEDFKRSCLGSFGHRDEDEA